MHRLYPLLIRRLQVQYRRDSWLRHRRTGVRIVRARPRAELWAHLAALLLPKRQPVSQTRHGDRHDEPESPQLRPSPVHTHFAAGAFDYHPRLKSKDVRWSDWQKQEIEGDALVLPLMIITFSCAYVLSLDMTICSLDNSLADAITLERYSTFATSMTG
jgi:hypothetical protein